MTSIFREVLGKNFDRLHPKIQERFDFDSRDGLASIGVGIMEEVWRGPFFMTPFFTFGSLRNIMFPEQGREVPFKIFNVAFRDRFGREGITFVRKFDFPRRHRRFDAAMIYSEARHRIVDYLGSHRHLAVDIELALADDGGIVFRSGRQRFHEGWLSFSFPMFFSGYAEAHEWYDETAGCYRIETTVANRFWGRIFGYRGRFQARRYVRRDGELPAALKPRREEARD